MDEYSINEKKTSSTINLVEHDWRCSTTVFFIIRYFIPLTNNTTYIKCIRYVIFKKSFTIWKKIVISYIKLLVRLSIFFPMPHNFILYLRLCLNFSHQYSITSNKLSHTHLKPIQRLKDLVTTAIYFMLYTNGNWKLFWFFHEIFRF